MATKVIKAKIKFRVPAGKATPAPPVGSSMGQHGLNMMDFINPFNEATKELGDVMIPVEMVVYEDRTFSFKTKTPATSGLIRAAAGVEKGSGVPNKTKVATLSAAQVESIAQAKLPDLNANDIEAAKKIVAGTARSMGIEVES
ncbi:MAG TPA: 50S ribosomal protein L11 [Candidatus Saccharimonadales bacterium]|nr:50S ribosomal protein L11 [Candidatus Saccharimonadales bacterium]